MTHGVHISPGTSLGQFPTCINKHLHLSRVVGSHFLVHIHINIPSTVVIKPNIFLLASCMWCTNAPNYENIIEIFNDNNATCGHFIYFSLLIKGVSPAVSALLRCPLWLTDWFFFPYALCAGSRRQVLSAAECCSVCGLQRPSLTFQQYFDGHRYFREAEETFLPASASQRKSWEGECQPVLMYLLWEDCDNKLWIAFLLLSSNSSFTTPHFLIFKEQFCRLSLSFQTGLTGTSTSSFHSHPACRKKRCCLCTCKTQRAHTVVKNGVKEEVQGRGTKY